LASAEKLSVKADYDGFVLLRKIDDLIVTESRSNLSCHPSEISKVFV